jgi:hypothetical protein
LIPTIADVLSTAQFSTDIQIDLRKCDQWVLWRGEDRINETTGEVTGLNKVPYTIHLHKASTTNPQTWASFEQCVQALPMALEAWEEHDPSASRGGGPFKCRLFSYATLGSGGEARSRSTAVSGLLGHRSGSMYPTGRG